MRTLELRYAGECRKCSAVLAVGAQAVYEKRVGVFCAGCAPTDPEEIRALRQDAADRKAERLEGWAAKRRSEATATLKHNECYTTDHAFNTQPGHIPIRARVIAANDRALESLGVAEEHERKAASLRANAARVKGDTERARQEQRDAIRPTLAKGLRVFTSLHGHGTVEKVNKKTATVAFERSTWPVDLSWIKVIANG